MLNEPRPMIVRPSASEPLGLSHGLSYFNEVAGGPANGHAGARRQRGLGPGPLLPARLRQGKPRGKAAARGSTSAKLEPASGRNRGSPPRKCRRSRRGVFSSRTPRVGPQPSWYAVSVAILCAAGRSASRQPRVGVLTRPRSTRLHLCQRPADEQRADGRITFPHSTRRCLRSWARRSGCSALAGPAARPARKTDDTLGGPGRERVPVGRDSIFSLQMKPKHPVVVEVVRWSHLRRGSGAGGGEGTNITLTRAA